MSNAVLTGTACTSLRGLVSVVACLENRVDVLAVRRARSHGEHWGQFSPLSAPPKFCCAQKHIGDNFPHLVPPQNFVVPRNIFLKHTIKTKTCSLKT